MINFEVYKENAEERLSYTSSDTPRTFIRALEDIVKLCEYGQKLKTENQTLQEQVQMRQELVEQYEQDITRLRQKVRELERQREFFIEALDKEHLCPRNCWPDGSSIDMQNCIEMNTKACWIRAYEHAAKETGKCVDVFSL